MTTGIEFLKLPKKRKVRGLGKKPALVGVSVRLPQDVTAYFDEHFPYTKQAKIREILLAYMEAHKKGDVA